MNAASELTGIDRLIADAILGIDTLWGGDAFHPSGTGRFIADSWFSKAPPPAAYTHPAARRLRQTGGVATSQPDHKAIQSYLDVVDVYGSISGVRNLRQSRRLENLEPLKAVIVSHPRVACVYLNICS